MKKINPINDRSDEELTAELERHVDHDRGFAWVVILALLFEAAVVWAYHHSEKLEAALLSLADLAIAGGVLGEIRSGRKMKMVADELDRRSKLELAAAHERASALEIEANEQREKTARAERELTKLKKKTDPPTLFDRIS